MELWIATSNSNKVKELKDLITGRDIQLHSQNEIDYYTSPKETGDTFYENATIKAESFYKTLNKAEAYVIAEDSGLVVEGLNNLPGIHSARYAGANARDSENNAKLLKMLKLKSPVNRNAYFHCSICLLGPDGIKKEFSGQIKGQIAKKLSGTSGFGYDPLFIPDGQETTMAELGSPYKNKHSHRALAFKSFLKDFSL